MSRDLLSSLSKKQLEQLKQKLHQQRGGLCYICEEPINMASQQTEIDHIVALALEGDDAEHNLAITHSGCNRSKGMRDLQLQRYIARFRNDLAEKTRTENLGTALTVGDVLNQYGGSVCDVGIELIDGGEAVRISYDDVRVQPHSFELPLLRDRSNPTIRSFIGMIPKECLFHEPNINPRSLVDLEPMIEEFYQKRPQLQPSLAILSANLPVGRGRIELFDGQHKAAAQIYNGADALLVRVFLNCDRDLINKTNFRAHTRLAQLHFPQLIADKVGHAIFEEEFSQYLTKCDMQKDSEEKFIKFLSKEVQAEYKGYLRSYLKYEALSSQQFNFMDFVETVSARSKRHPISFETFRRALLEPFLFLKPANEPLSDTQPMRTIERQNLCLLLELFAQKVLVDKFKTDIGIYRLEQRLQNGDPQVTLDHLTAYRMCRQAVMQTWAEQLREAIVIHLSGHSRYQSDWSRNRFFWAHIDEEDWNIIGRMIDVVRAHPAWTVKESSIASALATTKLGDWRQILLEGKLPGTADALYDPINGGKIYAKAVRMANTGTA